MIESITAKNEGSVPASAFQEEQQKAEHFTSQGELRLLHNDPAGIDLFQVAAQLDRDNPDLLYRQGLALFEYGSEAGREKVLRLAAKKFRVCTQLDPRFLSAWQAWGDLLNCQAILTGQWQFFDQAKEKFAKAIELNASANSSTDAELHWHYGFALLELAKHSGEAIDYQKAIDAFQHASSHPELFNEEFWVCFGKACKELGLRIGDIRLLVKSLHCFKHAVTLAVACFEAWRCMADTLRLLYERTHDEDHFSQANECFSAGAQLKPDSIEIWIDWAVFLYESGKRAHDLKRIRSAIEKCQRAAALDRTNTRLLAIWAECLASMGEITERLDLLHEAFNKVSEAASFSPHDLTVCLAHGNCLQAFGHYYQDCDYYYQAIEAWQAGLSQDRTSHRLWHAIACTYLMVGTIESDVESIERSCHFFNKACDLNGSSVYFFDYALALSKLGEMNRKVEWLEQSIVYFEKALGLQKNAAYLHPEWLFYYACTIDMLGDYHEDPSIYSRSIEIFSHVLTIDPDFPMIHHRLGLAFTHMGELLNELEYFQRAVHCMRLAARRDEDNDQILLDWAIALINLAQYSQDAAEADASLREAELKLTQACKLGNLQAYYQMACLNSLLGNYERAMRFIEKADEFDSLPPMDELLQDEWLDGLRATPYFREFIHRIEKARVSEADEDAIDDLEP
jgi:tetratricopeptide (TPR) repeat protein